jgi:hypothetical protein
MVHEKIKHIIAYIIDRYTDKKLLSKSRLAKTIYLIDWRSAIQSDKQMTNIEWIYNNHGPYFDVAKMLEGDDRFNVIPIEGATTEPRELVQMKAQLKYDKLKQEDLKVIDWVISYTEKMTTEKFINLIYSTYPIMIQERFSKLELPELAKEYKNYNDA